MSIDPIVADLAALRRARPLTFGLYCLLAIIADAALAVFAVPLSILAGAVLGAIIGIVFAVGLLCLAFMLIAQAHRA